MYLKPDYIRAGCRKSPMVRFAVYCMGAAIAPKSSLPNGLSNRSEMAHLYYVRAAAHFGIAISTPNEIGVLGLLMISLADLKVERGSFCFPSYV